MKFRVGTLSAVVALAYILSAPSVFSFQFQCRHLESRSTRIASAGIQANTMVGRRVETLRKLAVGDDDDDDDADEPLSNGVDSVSWLPTVVGAKEVDASSDGGDVSAVLHFGHLKPILL